ncbi:MAG: hypothetical protein GKS06_04790 [Acidobacteria bacterium]|nr:hypothetical protein [Acidobacteriota bacterium]
MKEPDQDRSNVPEWLSGLRDGAQQFGSIGHVGLMFPVSIAFGMGIGYLLDGWLDTAPWLMLLGFFFGVATATRELLRAAAKLDESDPPDDGPTWEG